MNGFAAAEMVQGLLLAVDDVLLAQGNDPNCDRLTALAPLLEAVDIESRGLDELTVDDVAGVPDWLGRRIVEFRTLARHGGPLAEDIGLAWDGVGTGPLGQVDVLAALFDEALRYRRRALAAGTTLTWKTPTGVAVPVVHRSGEGRGLVVRLHRDDTATADDGELRTAPVGRHLGDLIGRPWEPDFAAAVADGTRAARAALTPLRVKPKSGDYHVSGVLTGPPLVDRSVGLPVALDVIGASVPALGPPPVASTGSLTRRADYGWVLDDMHATSGPDGHDPAIRAKVEAVRRWQPGAVVQGPSSATQWMIVRDSQPPVGVGAVPEPACGRPPGLTDAAEAVWGDAWRTWRDERRNRCLSRHGLSIVERTGALEVDGRAVIVSTPLEERVADHFLRHLAAFPAAEGRWHATDLILASGPSTGRTWAVLGAAERLEREGWHVLVVRPTGAESVLPGADALIEVADLHFPAGCPHNLLVVDDVRALPVAMDPSAMWEEVVGTLLERRVNVALVLTGDRTQGGLNLEMYDWKTDRASETLEGLRGDERDALLEAVTAKAGGVWKSWWRAADRPRWLATQMTELAGHLHAQEVDARVRDVPFGALGAASAEQEKAQAAAAAVAEMGLTPSRAFLDRHRLPAAFRRPVTRADAKMYLDRAPDPRRRGELVASGLDAYVRTLLDAHALTDLAVVLRRSAVDHEARHIIDMFGERRDGAPHTGRIGWRKLLDAVGSEFTDYLGIARIVDVLARFAPDDVRDDLRRALATAIRDGGHDDEVPDDLAVALEVFRARRYDVRDPTVSAEYTATVRTAVNAARLRRVLGNVTRIGRRHGLMRAVFRLHEDVDVDDRVDMFDTVVSCESVLFSTAHPRSASELRAAIAMADTLVKELAGAGASTTLSLPALRSQIDLSGLEVLSAQEPDDRWGTEARLTHAALARLCDDAPPTPEQLVDSIGRSSSWHLSELVRGLRDLETVSPEYARRTVRLLLDRGLSRLMSDRLVSSPPAQASEAVRFLLRHNSAGLHRMLYPDGERPDPTLAASLATMISEQSDAKGVGMLLRSFVAVDHDLAPPDGGFTAQVIRRVDSQQFDAMLRGERLSATSYLVEALLACPPDLVESVIKRVLPKIVENLTVVRNDREWAPRLALQLIDAQSDGDLGHLGDVQVVDRLATAINDRNTLQEKLRSSATPAELELNHRLAWRIDRQSGSTGATGLVRTFAEQFDAASCPFCQLDRRGEPETVLQAARVLLTGLRRGRHPDPHGAVRGRLEDHWTGREKRTFTQSLRLPRNPGGAAATLELLRDVESVGVALRDRIPTEHVVFCMQHAPPYEAARLLQAAERLRPGWSKEIKDELDRLGDWTAVVDRVEDEERARSRATGARLMVQTVGEPTRAQRPRLVADVRAVVGATRSLPLLVESVRLLALWDRTVARAEVRRYPWGLLRSGPVRRGDLSHYVDMIECLHGLGRADDAATLLHTAIGEQAHRRMPLDVLGRFLRLVHDLTATRDDDRRRVVRAAADRLAEEATRPAKNDTSHLLALGWAGRWLDAMGARVMVADRPESLTGRPDPLARMWATAWIDGPDDRSWSPGQERTSIRPQVTAALGHDLLGASAAARGLAVLLATGTVEDVLDGLQLTRVVERAAGANPSALRVLLEEASWAPDPSVRDRLGDVAPRMVDTLRHPRWATHADRREAAVLVSRLPRSAQASLPAATR